MVKVFLVQSAGAGAFKKLAKDGVKSHDFDCYAPVTTYYVCKSKENAVNDCRKNNRKETLLRYFVNEVSFY